MPLYLGCILIEISHEPTNQVRLVSALVKCDFLPTMSATYGKT
jgi:hypothetical protein